MARGRTRGNIYRQRALGTRPALQGIAGAIVFVVVALAIYLAETSDQGIPFVSYRTVYVSVPNIGHLQAHDPVQIDGVYVGQVETISTAHNRPLAKLQLSGVGPLPTSTQAIVRADGLLGARYMELDPGTAKTVLPNGATITERGEHNSYYWGIPDALNLFDTKTRDALGAMWRGFGTGLEGRGVQLNRAIGTGPDSGADFDQAAYAILARPGAAQDFFPAQVAGWSAFNSTGNLLTDGFDPEATTAQAFVTKRGATEAFIKEFPSSEAGIDVGFAPHTGPPFWNSVANLADTLKPVLPQLPHALHVVVSFLRGTQQPLRNTLPALNEVKLAVPPTLHILTSLKPDLSPLKQAFTDLVQPVTSLSEHGCDIQNFATGTLGLTAVGTQPGGNWGPDVGFPLGVMLQPNGYLNSYVNTGKSPFIANTGYYAPCQFSPGPTINSTTLSGILTSLLGGAL
jgi:ABC-type transporter Mla subunit MlaD